MLENKMFFIEQCVFIFRTSHKRRTSLNRENTLCFWKRKPALIDREKQRQGLQSPILHPWYNYYKTEDRRDLILGFKSIPTTTNIVDIENVLSVSELTTNLRECHRDRRVDFSYDLCVGVPNLRLLIEFWCLFSIVSS